MLDLKQDYFALFGLTPAFRIDEERLEQAYLDLQGRVHPDRFAHLSDAEKRQSMQWATHVNEAFRTLKGPLTRGHYLLELRGVDRVKNIFRIEVFKDHITQVHIVFAC